MEWNQRAKLRRYVKISLGLHLGSLALLVAGKWIPLGQRELLMPAVQIDMVALPDLVKSQNRPPVDTSLPVKENQQPPPPPPPREEERMAAPAPTPPKPAPDPQKELAQKRAAEREAQRALERVRAQLRRDQQQQEERSRQQLISERQRDMKRFEEAYRAALRGNQLNEGTSATGEMQATMNAYFGHIRERLHSNWALPVFLQNRGLRAVVRVYIDGRGNIVRYHFTQFSGDDVFDEYVKTALQRSTPFSPPPEEMGRGLRNSGLEVQFPL